MALEDEWFEITFSSKSLLGMRQSSSLLLLNLPSCYCFIQFSLFYFLKVVNCFSL